MARLCPNSNHNCHNSDAWTKRCWFHGHLRSTGVSGFLWLVMLACVEALCWRCSSQMTEKRKPPFVGFATSRLRTCCANHMHNSGYLDISCTSLKLWQNEDRRHKTSTSLRNWLYQTQRLQWTAMTLPGLNVGACQCCGRSGDRSRCGDSVRDDFRPLAGSKRSVDPWLRRYLELSWVMALAWSSY